MNVSDYNDTFYAFTEKASDHARTAAFAGIALAWVFKINSQEMPRLPAPLVLPTLCFALALGLDLFQYVLGSLIWWAFLRHLEKHADKYADRDDLDHPLCFTYIINTPFVLKLLLVIVGYVLVSAYITSVWRSA